MSASREAYSRYRLLDERLRTRPAPTLNDLVDYCSDALGKTVSRRTVQADLQNLRYDQGLRFEAPIVFDRSTLTYSYKDPTYSITNLPVTAEELQGLDFAISVLEQFSHLTPIREFEDAILRIADTVKWNKDHRKLSEFIRLDKPFPVKGTEFLETLLQAIGRQEVIRFNYQKYESEEVRNRLLEPILIREYRNFWYVIGISREKEDAQLLTFALDRITDLELTGTYFKTEQLSREDLYQDLIGVTRGSAEAETIELFATPLQGRYLKANPIHHSQEVLADDSTGVLLRLRLQINYELKATLLGFGSSIQVLKPLHLAESMREESKKMLALYQ